MKKNSPALVIAGAIGAIALIVVLVVALTTEPGGVTRSRMLIAWLIGILIPIAIAAGAVALKRWRD